MQGQIRLNGRDLANKMQALKAKSKCFACDKVGHWAGDPECTAGGSEKGRTALKGRGQPGGFLARTGLALAALVMKPALFIAESVQSL